MDGRTDGPKKYTFSLKILQMFFLILAWMQLFTIGVFWKYHNEVDNELNSLINSLSNQNFRTELKVQKFISWLEGRF